MKGKCDKCGDEAVLYSYDTKSVCTNCLENLSSKSNTCPNCGFQTVESDEVSLMLTRPKASAAELSIAKEVPVIVCPKCRILFFDEFIFKILEGLR